MAHDEVHPEPEEGCRECVNTRRRSPFEGQTIDDLLKKALLALPEPTEEETAESTRRLFDDIAERLRRDGFDGSDTDNR